MQPGRKRHKVTLYRRVDTKLPSGQLQHTYEAFATPWAEIRPISGREFFAAAQVQSEVTTRIIINYRVDVDETCRVGHVVQYASPMIEEFYDIVAALPDSQTGRSELTLMCVRRRAEGWRG